MSTSICSESCNSTRAQFNCPDHWHELACLNRRREVGMHQVEVFFTEVKCSCGHKEETVEGDRLRPAYVHARANAPAVVIDHRQNNPAGF